MTTKLLFTAAVAIGAYPIITILLYIVVPITPHWAIWHRTIIVTPFMAFLMVWLLIPAINNLLSKLSPSSQSHEEKKTE